MIKAETNELKATLIKVDTALESMRDSGFDLSTAIGEPVDNSIEAGAHNIKIITGFKKTSKKGIQEILISDDGDGIDPKLLAKTLTLGFSTRYNSRKGMGRFGVGMKLAGISLGRRIDIFSKKPNDSNIYHASIDLDEITANKQSEIQVNICDKFPSRYQDSMKKANGDFYQSGTLVVWSKIDKLIHGGKYGNSIEMQVNELTKFLGRAYRNFIDKGISIKLDEKEIKIFDPLYLLENEMVTKLVGEDVRAKVIDQGHFKIDSKDVEVTVTLLPEVFRRVMGEGGFKGSAKKFSPLKINQNQGCISLVRQGREIYYDIIPRILPDGVDKLDRFIGIELNFPATLDEYFSVRHVKRGAEPVDKLREELKKWLVKPVNEARKQIREFWNEESKKKSEKGNTHEDAIDAVKKVEETAPQGRAGKDLEDDLINEIINEAIEDLGIDRDKNPEEAEETANHIKEQPFTIIDSSWPGKDMLDIQHLNGKAIIKLNKRHPFYKDIYSKVRLLEEKDISTMEKHDISHYARMIKGSIDILILAYAKAENMHSNPEIAYGELRTQWGLFTSAYVSELIKNLKPE